MYTTWCTNGGLKKPQPVPPRHVELWRERSRLLSRWLRTNFPGFQESPSISLHIPLRIKHVFLSHTHTSTQYEKRLDNPFASINALIREMILISLRIIASE